MRSRGHLYEELPVDSRPVENEEESDEMSQAGHTAGGQGTLPSLNLSQANNSFTSREHLMHNNSNPEFSCTYPRKRHNPLYDRSDDLDIPEKPNGGSSGPGLCTCVVILFVFLLSVVAICLSVYVLLKQMQDKEEATIAQVIHPGASNETLLQKIEDLERQLSDVRTSVARQNHTMAADADEKGRLLTALDSRTQALNDLIQALDDNVTHVTKMQGPPGVGNLSACVYQFHSNGAAAAGPPHLSPTVPESLQHHEDWVIMGLECSTGGGVTANLKKSTATDSGSTYDTFTCECGGGSSGARTCYIHVWQCPRIS